VWLCYGYLRGVVMLWEFKGCGYVNLRGVVMVFKGCGYAMSIEGMLLCYNITTPLKYP
jgi:hypothetical protein